MPPKQRKSAGESVDSAVSTTVSSGKSAGANPKVAKSGSKPALTTKRSDVPEFIDVYMRMQEDPNKDYCFTIPTGEPVSWSFRIFEKIPILLSPSYFFDAKPQGFAISIHPGYMTAEGGILFTDKAHHEQWTKKIPQTALIRDVITEGQLIIPVWKHRTDRESRVIAGLSFWLYLDLPEFISPTPGTAPSQVLYWSSNFFFEPPRLSEGKPSSFSNHWCQISFFLFHILKVCAVYLISWNGLWHPATLNPFSSPNVRTKGKKLPNADDLNNVGWTGTRRCGLYEWSERYLNVVTERAGGVSEAHRQGLLLKAIGLYLREDEGWNVLKDKSLDEVEVQEDLSDDEGKFVVSKPYFAELSKPSTNFLKNPETTEAEGLAMLKEFRETGGVLGTDFMREFFSDLVEHDQHEYGGQHIDQMGKNS